VVDFQLKITIIINMKKGDTMPVKKSGADTILYKTSQGKVNEVGIDQPDCTIITENETHLVIKLPARDYWVGLGMNRGYASPETIVYEKLNPCEPGSWKRLECNVAIAWENTRKKKKK
jgi:hypothetical protein